MIRLYEDEAASLDIPSIYGGDFYKEDVELYDIVSCAGYEWYVIDIKDDIVTLLAKDEVFGKSIFDEDSSDYKTSEIRKYLRYKVLPKLQKANPIATILEDVGCTDKVWLLSWGEVYDHLNKEIREFDHWWWLRSRGYNDYLAEFIFSEGRYSREGHTYDSLSVRPAMRVRIEDLD